MTPSATVLGVAVRSTRALAGGSVHRVEALELVDGRTVVRKSAARGSLGAVPEDLFAAEAAGLRWLGEAEAVSIPAVLEASRTRLILEYLPAGAPVPDFDERLGRCLAALHRAGAPGFGWPRRNYIAALEQAPVEPGTYTRWSSFYGEQRLRPMAALADRAIGGHRLRSRIDALGLKLSARLDDTEGPARLHGDLWAGNLHRTSDGRPALIDPAVYGGHREMDLAMMRLFGGFSSAVFDAYEESAPLVPGARDRLDLHQLYPLLVHVALFDNPGGGGYVSRVDAILRRHGV